MLGRRGEDGLDDGGRDVGGDHDLLEETGHDQPQGARVVDGPRIALAAELRQELVAPDDRPRQKMGEEGEVEGQVERAGRLQLATVDVDHIAQRHEREERDGDGERHLKEGDGAPESHGMGEVVEVDRDEAVVLEPPEQAQ